GSTSLWQEVELVQLYDDVFKQLNLKGITIKLNNRKILSGIAEVIGAEDKLIDFTVALDKLDKIGEEGVKTEMLSKGISIEALNKLNPLFVLNGTASEKLSELKKMLFSSKTGLKGIEELEFITNAFETLSLKSTLLEVDVTLARGLNYYTGAIFEVSSPEGVSMGSIGGGGRYDDLTGIFGLKNTSGVGISFGLDRIYLVLEELNIFPETVLATTKVLFINFGDKESLYAMQAISKLRENGIASELYPDQTKMGKQMGYADKRKIPFVILAGDKEIESQSYTLKSMLSGDQSNYTLDELISFFN
ncbi:MAG: histidine--tRNA ligase, partial [Flavobacteriaceae bacterium]|nr:histidine--tRNA ligase [Flavobacteriaceae bacterium]